MFTYICLYICSKVVFKCTLDRLHDRVPLAQVMGNKGISVAWSILISPSCSFQSNHTKSFQHRQSFGTRADGKNRESMIISLLGSGARYLKEGYL